jgi:hypothetical protein
VLILKWLKQFLINFYVESSKNSTETLFWKCILRMTKNERKGKKWKSKMSKKWQKKRKIPFTNNKISHNVTHRKTQKYSEICCRLLIQYWYFLTAEAVLVIAFTLPPPHPHPLSNPVQNFSSIVIMLLRYYYGIY